MEQRSDFGGVIRAARLHKSMTQEAVAEELGVTQTTVSSWERDPATIEPGDRKVYPAAANLYRLAQVLELDVEDLIGQMVAESEAVPA